MHPILFVIHVLAAVVWLGSLPAQLIIFKSIKSAGEIQTRNNLISLFLKLTNIGGIIGMTGVLITGVIMTAVLPYYGFFEFTVNHWLVSKQVLMVILILLVFGFVIPKAMQIRLSIEGAVSKNDSQENILKLVKSLNSFLLTTNILVLLNFLFALSFRFIR